VAKNVFDPLTSSVPRSIASKGVRGSDGSGGHRKDRPLGRQGVDLLGQVPLFAGLSRRNLKRLAEHADIVSFNERDPIVEADQPGGTFYVLLEGEAKVIRGSRTIDRMGPGDFFGEISLLDGGPRTATVTAETPVSAIRIFKRSFDKVVSQEPSVAAQILVVVARRLRESQQTLSA
jgi:CRP/FNR family transcriptional regulator, cyclic AMP receptor protein